MVELYNNDIKMQIIKKGTKDGIEYIICTLGTHPTAYVVVPEELYDDYKSFEIFIHGGITLYGKHEQLDELVNEKNLYLGWDYAHYMDYMTSYDDIYFARRFHKYTIDEIMEDVNIAIDYVKEKQNDKSRKMETV